MASRLTLFAGGIIGVICLVLLMAFGTGGAGNGDSGGLMRTAVNPWQWSLGYGFNQGEILTGGRRHLVLAGQAAIDANGEVAYAGDLRAQMMLALDNIETVLRAADMTMSNITHLTIFTTDIEETLANWDAFGERMDAAGIKPPQSLIGVAQLAFPDLMIEIEATADD